MIKKKIVYTGSVEFPSNSAAARRIIGNLKAFQNAGYLTTVLNAGESEVQYLDNIEIVNLGERKNEEMPRLFKHLSYLTIGREALEWLDKNKMDIEAVVLYSGYSPYLLRLLPWCKKNDIKLIFDAVEWYDAKGFLYYFIDPYYWNIELAMRILIKRTKNVIAISSYLESYYRKRKCNTIVIPPLIDIDSIDPNLDPNEGKVIISYTGNPGRKDLFNNYLEAIDFINKKYGLVEFRIAGINKTDLLKFDYFKTRNLKFLPSYIKNFGKVSFKDSIEITKQSDFSLLQRPYLRSTIAGFPTKFVESISLGTPVILNITSDLGEYVNDTNGIICLDDSLESLKRGLEKGIKLTQKEKKAMRYNCRKLAFEKFDYKNFTNPLNTFIQNA